LTLLFGVAGKCRRELLVEMAIVVSFDLMRWAEEGWWRCDGERNLPPKGRFLIAIAVSSGMDSVFVFDLERPCILEMRGPVFDKQMELRQYSELNRIVCCAETNRILEELKIGCHFNAWDNVFIDQFYQTPAEESEQEIIEEE
jgi:hypothetical protein